MEILSGFRNIGQSCFLNAALQCLFQLPRVVSNLGTSNVEAALRGVLADAAAAKHAVVPKKITDIYYRGQQEDVNEFLLQLLADYPSVHAVFSGIEIGILSCRYCGCQRQLQAEPFLALQLQVANMHSVQEALTSYMVTKQESESVWDWCCLSSECLDMGRAQHNPLRSSRIRKWPDVLMLCLKRWQSMDDLLAHKIRCEQEVFVDNLAYQLQAVATHIGESPRSGHYIACRRQGPDFVQCDDDRVSILRPIQAEHFVTRPGKKVYVLFYEKKALEVVDAVAAAVDDNPTPAPVADTRFLTENAREESQVSTQTSEPPALRSSQKRQSSEHKTNRPKWGRLVPGTSAINLDCSSDDSDVIVQSSNVDMPMAAQPLSQTESRPTAKTGPVGPPISRFAESERMAIAKIVKEASTCRDAIGALAAAKIPLTTKDPKSPTYVPYQTLRRWVMDPTAFSKSLQTCNKMTKNTKSSRSRPGTVRHGLSDEARHAIGDALDNAVSATDLIHRLADQLPDFSVKNREAGNYISRGTLHNWFSRPSMADWFKRDEKAQQEPFAVAAALPAGMVHKAEPDNSTDTWLRTGAWTCCSLCGRNRPVTAVALNNARPLDSCQPCCDASAEALLEEAPADLPSGKLMAYVTPQKNDWSQLLTAMDVKALPLRQALSEQELHSLAVLDLKIECCTRRGGQATITSKQKRSVVHAKWKAQKMAEVQRTAAAAKAFDWLVRNNPTYAGWVEYHSELMDTAEKPSTWRHVPTAKLLLNCPGIEIAARPWLYPFASYADTDHRGRLVPLNWINAKAKPSLRASFLRKILSQCYDYRVDFELQCLLYDIAMARSITSIIAVANRLHIAPEFAAADQDMWEGYWHQQIAKMEDICRQEYRR